MSPAINQIEKILSLCVSDKEQTATIIDLIKDAFNNHSYGEYMKLSAAAFMISCEEKLIKKLIKDGALKAKRMPSDDIRVLKSSILKYMENLPDAYNSDELRIKKQVDKLIRDGVLC